MAQTWLDYSLLPLRILIGDYAATPTYTDARLTELLIVAGLQVNQQISFSTTYTINVPNLEITPDPVDDTVFLNFLVLKAACLADQSTFRTKALAEGIRASLGPASLSVSGNLKGFQYLLEHGPCATYEQMRKDYVFGNAANIAAILSPFCSNTFDPSVLYDRHDSRDRFN